MSDDLENGKVALYRPGIAWLATQKLTGEQWKVLLYMLGSVDMQNSINLSQKEIAEELGINQPQVSRSIKRLVELGVIEKGPRDGLNKTYILKPYIGVRDMTKIPEVEKEIERLELFAK